MHFLRGQGNWVSIMDKETEVNKLIKIDRKVGSELLGILNIKTHIKKYCPGKRQKTKNNSHKNGRGAADSREQVQWTRFSSLSRQEALRASFFLLCSVKFWISGLLSTVWCWAP